jgi:hemolysin III
MYMKKNELLNVVTSLPGAVAAVAGVMVLVAAAVHRGDPWKIVSFAVYGGTLFFLYVSATLYHLLRGRIKRLFCTLDHYAIYLLIAGTYTPFCLVTLRGAWGWSLFALVWGLAILGIWLEHRKFKGYRRMSMLIYLGMGWLVVIAIGPLLEVLPVQGVVWLAIGGVFYTGGTVFYFLDRRFAWAHGFWHLCVLAGSVSHFVALFRYVA